MVCGQLLEELRRRLDGYELIKHVRAKGMMLAIELVRASHSLGAIWEVGRTLAGHAVKARSGLRSSARSPFRPRPG